MVTSTKQSFDPKVQETSLKMRKMYYKYQRIKELDVRLFLLVI